MLGLVKPGQETEETGLNEQASNGAAATADENDESPKLKHSATLIEDLTAQKTAALRVESANNPDIALSRRSRYAAACRL